MFTDVYATALHAEKFDADMSLAITDVSIELPTDTGWDAFAEICLTTHSNGFNVAGYKGGASATRIVGAYHIGQSGGEYMSFPSNWNDDNLLSNYASVSRCISVDFRLGAAYAYAYALAKVWFKRPPAAASVNPAQLRFVEKAFAVGLKSGKFAGQHYHYRHVSAKKRMPADDALRSIALKRAATLLDVPRSRLALRRLKPAASGDMAVRSRVRKDLAMRLP